MSENPLKNRLVLLLVIVVAVLAIALLRQNRSDDSHEKELSKIEREKLDRENKETLEAMEQSQRVQDFFLKANTANINKNYEEAVVYYKKILEIRPDNAEAKSGMELANARLNPDYTESYNNMELASFEEQDLDKAIKYYEQNPKPDAEVYNNICWLYALKEAYNQALAHCEKSIKLNPNYPYTYHSMGFVYAGKKNYDKAIKNYRKAIELFEKSPEFEESLAEAYYDMGEAYKKKKDNKKAQEYQQKAQKLGYKAP